MCKVAGQLPDPQTGQPKKRQQMARSLGTDLQSGEPYDHPRISTIGITSGRETPIDYFQVHGSAW